MITLELPDKWVRKAVYDRVNGQIVDGVPIPCFDWRTQDQYPTDYVLMASQSNEPEGLLMCGDRWNHIMNIECYTRRPSAGNPGSRLACDEITAMVLRQLQALQLDPASGMRIARYNVFLLSDFYEDDGQFVVASKIVELSAVIN